MPTAELNGAVIARATDDEVVHIEGNVYFPPSAVRAGILTESLTPYTCPWKGRCQYFDISEEGASVHDAAWSYPDPYPTAIERVGHDFGGYVAFSPQVRVS